MRNLGLKPARRSGIVGLTPIIRRRVLDLSVASLRMPEGAAGSTDFIYSTVDTVADQLLIGREL